MSNKKGGPTYTSEEVTQLISFPLTLYSALVENTKYTLLEVKVTGLSSSVCQNSSHCALPIVLFGTLLCHTRCNYFMFVAFKVWKNSEL